MKVAILLPPRYSDGRPDQEDTFWQADEVTECLRQLGHEALWTEYADHGPQTAANLGATCADLVFNLVEDVPEGSDQVHLATALLDRLGLRYTGARTASLAALGSKRLMKARLRDAGLPTCPLLGEVPPDSRFIVKSDTEHASLGIDTSSVVTGVAAARAVIAERTARFGGSWFAEVYIEGREFDISVLGHRDGPQIMPIAEVDFSTYADGRMRLFDYASKWLPETPESRAVNRVFRPREEPLFSELERLTLAAWHCFDLSGFAHVDFRVDEAGKPFILEVNANPCIGREAGMCESAARAGMSQTDVIAALLAAA